MPGTTIAAIASPPGAGRRAVIRISGGEASAILGGLWAGDPPPLARRACFEGRVHDGRGEQPALILWMPGPHSLTREDVAELHVVGAPPLVAALFDRVLALGAVPAGPGEFTRRAFLAGRIDLLRAEGVLSLVEAENESERRAATALLFGGLSDRIEALRGRLADARALAEASLDFDEADTGHVPDDELRELTRAAHAGLLDALSWEERRGASSGEPRIVLCGAPNAGKSLLYNALTGADAIVSDVPGTTRDVLGAPWTLGGTPCRLVDTAGLEPLDGPSAVHGARASAQVVAGDQRDAADLVLWVVDAERTDVEALLREGDSLGKHAPMLLVWNRTDRPQAAARPPAALQGYEWIATSGRTGAGLGELGEGVSRALGIASTGSAADPAAGKNGPRRSPSGSSGRAAGSTLARELSARHRRALAAAAAEVQLALDARAQGAPLDLFAAGLATATDELDAITGTTSPDDVLDRVFARFCIGK